MSSPLLPSLPSPFLYAYSSVSLSSLSIPPPLLTHLLLLLASPDLPHTAGPPPQRTYITREIVATDGGNRNSSVELAVTITNVKNQPPQWERESYDVVIAENTVRDTPIVVRQILGWNSLGLNIYTGAVVQIAMHAFELALGIQNTNNSFALNVEVCCISSGKIEPEFLESVAEDISSLRPNANIMDSAILM